MLRLGHRLHHLVPAHSGLHVTLDPNAHPLQRQTWRLDVHYVPGAEEGGLTGPWQWRYWQVRLDLGIALQTTDWRTLAEGLAADEDDLGPPPICCTIENLLASRTAQARVRNLAVGTLRFVRRDGWLLTCEADGEVLDGENASEPAAEETDAAPPGPFTLLEAVPFATATVHVPLNVADPEAAARRIAAREIGLKETARAYVRRFQEGAYSPRFASRGKHTVTLETPWRAARA